MSAILHGMFAHNRWANERVLEACRGLGSEQLATSVHGTYGALGRTLLHLVRAESWYVHLLTGWDPQVRWEYDDPFPGVDALTERVRFTGDRLLELAKGGDGDRTLRIEEDDGVYEVPAWVVMVQAVNHAHDHRGHVATILTQLGIQPPEVDGWAFGEAQD